MSADDGRYEIDDCASGPGQSRGRVVTWLTPLVPAWACDDRPVGSIVTRLIVPSGEFCRR